MTQKEIIKYLRQDPTNENELAAADMLEKDAKRGKLARRVKWLEEQQAQDREFVDNLQHNLCADISALASRLNQHAGDPNAAPAPEASEDAPGLMKRIVQAVKNACGASALKEVDDLMDRVDAIVDGLRAERDAAVQRADHSDCHDVVCNGSRRLPRGADGCSCGGRLQRAEAEIERLTEHNKLQGNVIKADEQCRSETPDYDRLCIAQTALREYEAARHASDADVSAHPIMGPLEAQRNLEHDLADSKAKVRQLQLTLTATVKDAERWRDAFHVVDGRADKAVAERDAALQRAQTAEAIVRADSDLLAERLAEIARLTEHDKLQSDLIEAYHEWFSDDPAGNDPEREACELRVCKCAERLYSFEAAHSAPESEVGS